jgi:uncharacterized repeat protein (TIGR02543 family)
LVTQPADPVKENHTFLYWEWQGEEVDFSTFTVTNNHVIAPEWIFANYTVTFETFGGSSIDTIDGLTPGDLIDEPAEPTRTGYVFEGWFSDEERTIPFDFLSDEITYHTTLYADWDPDDFTITFETNGGTTIDPITQAYLSEVTAPEDPTKVGHTFSGWFSDVELATEYEFTTIPDHDITIYAKWSVNTYTITFETNEGSTIAPAVYDYDEETEAPTAPTRATYTFAGWYSDEELTTPYVFTTMPAENITIYAKWVIYEDVPPTPASTDYADLFLEYWYLIPIAAIVIALVATMFKKPKRRYRRRY